MSKIPKLAILASVMASIGMSVTLSNGTKLRCFPEMSEKEKLARIKAEQEAIEKAKLKRDRKAKRKPL